MIGDDNLEVFGTHVVGLITCMTSLDPFEVVQKLKAMAIENAYQFRYAIRFTPLEKCVKSEIDEIIEATKELLPKIDEDETFRVTVRRRHTDLENMEVVGAIAKIVPREVDLDSPDKTIWVEIVNELTGISVLDRDDDILSIMSMRDDMY
ncbi:MAG: THUMP domain-containing protein [Candidatus Thorarchaeota archaeon]|nr:THUMP domain-containing protein [Candidatus Thorarchaeota archaeon]